MSQSVSAALARQVGPLPLGVWLLVGAGGLWIARTRGDGIDGKDGADGTVQQVPVPVGAIASPDGSGGYVYDGGAATVGGTVVVPNVPTQTPPPSTAPKPVVTAPRPTPTPPPPTAPIVTHVYYVVRSGDTLSAIAARYHMSTATLYLRNRTVIEAAARAHGRTSSESGHWIYPGTRLMIR